MGKVGSGCALPCTGCFLSLGGLSGIRREGRVVLIVGYLQWPEIKMLSQALTQCKLSGATR